MHSSFRMVVGAFVILGIGIGVAFGAGVAYGRNGEDETTESGLSAQEIQQLLSGTGNAQNLPFDRQGGGGTGGGLVLGGNTTGQITAIDGNTITVDGPQGEVKVTLGDDTTVSVQNDGSVEELAVGDSVVIQGESDADGNLQASSVSELPTALSGLGGGGFQGGAPGQGPAASPTPSP